MQTTLDHFSGFNNSQTKSRKPVYRYRDSKYCNYCRRWIPREYDYCPFCFRMHLKIRPRNQRCKKRYSNVKEWSFNEAEKLFQRFVERGYSIDEAVEFVEAISGFKVDPKIIIPIRASKDAR